MQHHIDHIETILGTLMLICGIGFWIETLRRKWKASNAFQSAGYTVWGVSAILGGLNLSAVLSDVSGCLLILTLCFLAVGAVLRIKEARAARDANTGKQPASESAGSQFQGYRKFPRM